MMGALDWLGRRLIVTTSRSKRSTDFIALLQTLDFLYGPKPGIPGKPVVIVLDNGPIHTSKVTLAALAVREHWLTVEWLPKYAPELNDIEASGMISKPIISHTRLSPTPKPSTRPSTTLSQP